MTFLSDYAGGPPQGFSPSHHDILHSFANRVLHSHFWKAFYLCMLLLSLACLVGSYKSVCPGFALCALEIILNLGMLAEVSVRFLALGKVTKQTREGCAWAIMPLFLLYFDGVYRSPESLIAILFSLPQLFWQSYWNVLDIALVPLCLVTLMLILFTPCSAASRGEMEVEDLLLLFRNGVVLSRLLAVLQKNRSRLGQAPKNIDLGGTGGIDLMTDAVAGGRSLPLWDMHQDGLEDFI
ncbi:hypothetical protein HKX48_000429 [Thoreauomyces humboldtii]|nr:hypothetical protein HKX48_000429 [Thoreauomyces humboldtii]